MIKKILFCVALISLGIMNESVTEEIKPIEKTICESSNLKKEALSAEEQEIFNDFVKYYIAKYCIVSLIGGAVGLYMDSFEIDSAFSILLKTLIGFASVYGSLEFWRLIYLGLRKVMKA